MKLFEIKSTREWEWKSLDVDHSVAVFETPQGKTYAVEFGKVGPDNRPPPQVSTELERISRETRSTDIYVIYFELRTKHGPPTADVTGTGEASTVFATVLEIVKEFDSKFNPVAYVFASSGVEQSRIKLYDRLTSNMEKQGHKTKIMPMPGKRWYIWEMQ